MINLHTLQHLFIDAIFEDTGINPALNELENYISFNDKLSCKDQVNIYRNSIFGGLISALREIYPVCHKLVADDFFDFMATQYIYQHKSLSPDLTDYGEHLAEFISTFKPAASLPYLSDIAKLEWSWHQAFHAQDHSEFNINRLNKLNEKQYNNLIFHTPPGSNLITSCFPIHKIWNANQEDNNQSVNLDEGSVKLIVWRNGYDMHIDKLQKDEWLLLNEINNRVSLNDICDNNRHLFNAETLLPQCVKRGWITDFSI